jgi:hypothetical protein
MDKAQKFELMNKVVRELEDLQNSQTALITKISQIEVDNMNGLNDSYLEKIWAICIRKSRKMSIQSMRFSLTSKPNVTIMVKRMVLTLPRPKPLQQ